MSFNSKYRILIDECMPSEVTLINILGEFLSFFDSLFVSSGHSYPLHEGNCLKCIWLGCPAKFRLRDSPCQLYCIGSMDAEEDDQNFRLLDSTVYSLQPVMFLLCPKRTFHCFEVKRISHHFGLLHNYSYFCIVIPS